VRVQEILTMKIIRFYATKSIYKLNFRTLCEELVFLKYFYIRTSETSSCS